MKTVTVSTESELRDAAWNSQDGDCTIVIANNIDISDTIHFPDSDSYVKILGFGKFGAPIVSFRTMQFPGWPADGSFAIRANGWESRCGVLKVINTVFAHFNHSGAAVRGHVKRGFHFLKCVFANIGNKQFGPRIPDPAFAGDTVYNSCLACTRLYDGESNILDCRFNNCIRDNHTWSHGLYISAKKVVVSGNVANGCGNIFGVGGVVPGGRNTIVGNTIISPAKQWHHKWKRHVPAYLIGLGTDEVVFAINRVVGEHWRPITGQPDPEKHLFFNNDFGAMSYSDRWAANTAKGVYIPWEEWLSLGFDAYSVPPIHLGDRPTFLA